MSLLHYIYNPSVKSASELRRFTLGVSFCAISAALSVDILNQLLFYVDVVTCVRSWAITIVVAGALAHPISYGIGKAHLELYRAKLEAERLGRTDPLTGLLNRRALVEHTSAPASAVIALVIADIDRFKRVNDHFGHLAGDEVIRHVAQKMQLRLAEFGALARVGGEEFALICPAERYVQMLEALSRLLEEISKAPILLGGSTIQISISAGVAVAKNGESFERLYRSADDALYAAKSRGRNRVVRAEDIADPSKADLTTKADDETDSDRAFLRFG